MESRSLTTLRAGTSLRSGELTLIPVERSRVTVACDPMRLHARAAKEIAAIVLVTAGGARALDPCGEPVDIAELLAHASGLTEALSV